MANTMQFLRVNQLNTTTQIVVDSVNTATVGNLLDRDTRTRWRTVGYGTNTSTILSIEFATPTSIDKIYLQNHNLKQFRIFYNSATSNTFTPAISETTNSAPSNYFEFGTTTVNSIQIQVDLATTADTEKAIGEVYLGSLLMAFEQNPSAGNYTPVVDREQVVHKMPNGGVAIFNVADKFEAQIKLRYIASSFESSIRNVYDTGTTFVFVPFGTTTAWDGFAYEVAWTGKYDFKYASNNIDAGYNGTIILQETA
jgi:hypothetical protein